MCQNKKSDRSRPGALEIKGVSEAGLRELAEFGCGEAHLASDFVFAGEVGVEHGGVVGREDDRDAVAQQLRKWVVGEVGGIAVELTGEGAGSNVADGADFEGDTAIGEQVHESGVMNGGDAVADALDAEYFDGFADCFGAADFAGVDEAVESSGGSGFVHWLKISCGNTQFVASDAESDDSRRGATFCGLDHAHSGVGAELANGIEDPAQGEAARFECFGGAKDGSEVGCRLLAAEKHDADGESYFGIDDAVLQKLFAQIMSDERIVRGITEIRSDPLEGIEEAEEIGVVVAAANEVFGGGNAVASGEGADRCGLDGAFEMKV